MERACFARDTVRPQVPAHAGQELMWSSECAEERGQLPPALTNCGFVGA